MELKRTTKTDVICKKCYMQSGVLYDTESGLPIELLDTIQKVYGDQEVKLTVTASVTEEVDLDSESSESLDE